MAQNTENKNKRIEPVAIVGMACRLPGGANSPAGLWDLICAQTDAITEVPADRWQIDAFYGTGNSRTYSKWGGFIKGIEEFDAPFFRVGKAEAEQMDPQQRLLLEVAWEALEDAGIALDTGKPSNMGVFVGASTHDYGDLQYDGQELTPIGPYLATGVAQSIAANRLSYVFNLTGPSMTVDTACSSSLMALHLAVNSLRRGECEAALVGGVNCILTPNNYVAFSAMSALSHDGRCKAFDASADGFTRAEGAGVVAVKRLSDALRDGDRIYATVLATGANQDGNTSTIALPNPASQQALVSETCAAAGVAPAEVCYVEAHGTGTSVGDPAELNAIGRALCVNRRKDTPLVVGSVKTNVGHLEAGAGVVGLIKLALVLGKREAPPNLHFNKPNPNIPFDELNIRVPTDRLPLVPLARDDQGKDRFIGGVNSFGFGGANAHAVLSSFAAADSQEDAAGKAGFDEAAGASDRQTILTLSAAGEDALRELASRYRDFLAVPGDEGAAQPAARVARAAACRRGHLTHRLAVAGNDRAELGTRLGRWIDGESVNKLHAGRHTNTQPHSPVFVFSGQGPQWWGMGRKLLQTSQVFRDVIEKCDGYLKGIADWSLLEELLADEADSRMHDTRIAQPAIFALQAGVAAVLADHGVRPAAVVGHSVGEAAAAYTAGCLTLEQGVHLMFHRGLALSGTPAGGGMLAAGLTPQEAAAAIAPWCERGLTVAAVNGPGSVTISGEKAALEELAAEFEQKDIFNRFLRVNYAFHSAYMDGVEAGLKASLEFLVPTEPRIPLYSTVTGKRLLSTPVDGDYWWRNVRGTVDFLSAINTILDDGHAAFLEISAHPALVTNIRQIIGEHPLGAKGAFALPTLKRDGDDATSIIASICQLHCSGVAVDWDTFYRDVPGDYVDLPRYPWQHKPYLLESAINRESRLTVRPHPFLWRRISSPDPSWEVDLDPRHFAYLAHHVVNGRVVFPGAGYIEGALAASLEVLPSDHPVTLEDLEFEAMLIPGSEQISKVQFRVDSRSGAFAISSRVGGLGEAAWVRHATGRARTGGRHPGESLSALTSRICAPVDAAALYQVFQSIGLDYGTAFRGIEQVFAGDLEALCRVQLPDCAEARADASQYRFHPALLDACIQTILPALFSRGSGDSGLESAFVPVAIERVVYAAAAVNADVWCHTKLTTLTDKRLVADICLFDPDGNQLLVMEGVACKVLAPLRNAARRRSPPDWSYEVQWQEWPREEAIAARGADNAVASLVAAARPNLSPGLPSLGDENYAALESGLRGLLARVWKDGVAAKPSTGGSVNAAADELQGRFTDIITAGDGRTEASDWHTLIRAFPGFFAEIDIWRRLSHALQEVLQHRDGCDRLLDDGGDAVVEHYDTDSHTWYGINDGLARALKTVLDILPEGRDVRIMVHGSHAGGLVTHCQRHGLLSLHHPVMMTSSSARVVGLARRHFGKEPNASFAPWPFTGDAAEYKADILLVRDAGSVSDRDWAALLPRVAPGGLILAASRKQGSSLECMLDRLLDPEQEWPGGDDWASTLEAAGFELDRFSKPDVELCLALLPPNTVALAGASTAAVEAVEPKHWLLLDDGSTLSARIAAELVSLGHHCKVQGFEDFLAFTESPQGVMPAFDGVVFPAIDKEPLTDANKQDWVGSTLDASQRLLGLVRLLADDALFAETPRLNVVTMGASSTGDEAPQTRPSQTALTGMARVVMTELPNLHCRSLDVSPHPSAAEVRGLVFELLNPDTLEDEVAIRGETRYVPRVDRLDPYRRRATVSRDDSLFKTRLFSSKPGVLENLCLFREPRQAPAPGEVEIELRAAGLNFRDVMKALGIYPTEAGDGNILGDECSGVITAVGEGVEHLSAGDAVMAIAPGCFGSHVVTRAGMVMPLPEGWSWADGATTMIPYITAYYSLFVLARLRAGERVLIHAGTGGVGMAAIQLAMSAGAEVYTTAGSDAKRQLLRDYGVEYVFNSRTLDFADDIRAVTGGEGVDVVLNSLAGEAISQGLSVLRENGRFLEIGKRDIYENSSLGLRPFKKSLSYFAIDLARMMASGETGDVLNDMQTFFESGAIRPLPHRRFPLSAAVEAFRFMAEARHIGKVVLTVPEGRMQALAGAEGRVPACDPDKTYLVTGGLRGFGFSAAQWLHGLGARKLYLVSRSGVADEATAQGIEELRAAGTEIFAMAVDVSDEAQIEVCLRTMRQSAPVGGIVHAATVYDDCLLLQCEDSQFQNVIDTKAASAWSLHAQTLPDQPDLFVLFSSISALVGNAGQGNYVTANAFLEGLADLRDQQGLKTLVVGWDRITDTGYVARNARLGEYMDRMGFSGLSAREGMRVMEYLLGLGASRAVVTSVDWGDWLENAGFRTQSARWERLRKSSDGDQYAGDEWLQTLRDATPENRSPVLQGQLKSVIAKTLGRSGGDIDSTQPLMELGLDSLSVVELIGVVENKLGTSVPAGVVAGVGNALTVESLAEAILKLLQLEFVSTVSGEASSDTASSESGPAGKARAEELIADARLPDDLSFETAGAGLDGPVLLTGGSGFLGAYLLQALLRRMELPVYVLVRCGAADEGLERLKAGLRKYGLLDEVMHAFDKHVHAVSGNVSEAMFGLPAEQYEALTSSVTRVYHNAAVLNHLAPYAQLKPTNVGGSLEVLRFAATGTPKAVHYTSTIGVFTPADAIASGRLVGEDLVSTLPQNLLGGYAESKWVAEKLFRDARERGLSVSVYRPGQLIGDTNLGICNPDDALWRFFRVAASLGVAPSIAQSTHLTRVDFTAEAIAEISLDPDALNGTYHLVGKPDLSLSDIFDAFESLGYAMRTVTSEEFFEILDDPKNEEAIKPLLPYLLLFPEHLSDLLIEGNQSLVFDTSAALARIDAATKERLQVAPGALHCCIRHFEDIGFLDTPKARSKAIADARAG